MSTTFSAYDIRGRAGDTLTVEQAWNVGKAFADWLPQDGSVAITQGPGANSELVHALTEGVLLQGRDVVALGEGTQDAVVGAIGEGKAVGGVLIEHEDAQDLTVISLFEASGASVTDANGLTEIAELLDAGNFIPADQKGELKTL